LLLPGHLRTQFTTSHLRLIELSSKIDNYLLYQKNFRSNKSGDLFKNIKLNIYANYQILIDVSLIRQILFINKNFYTIKK
jgi:hypothetical protein